MGVRAWTSRRSIRKYDCYAMAQKTLSIYRGDRSDFALYAKLGSASQTAIASIALGANEVRVTGNWTAQVSTGDTIAISDHPDNDGRYEASSVSYDNGAGETVLGLVESLTTDAVEGYVLFPWNLESDFEDLHMDVKPSLRASPFATWKTEDGTLETKNGDGQGDKVVFRVPSSTFEGDRFRRPLVVDLEGVGADGSLFTIIPGGVVEIELTEDVTQVE